MGLVSQNYLTLARTDADQDNEVENIGKVNYVALAAIVALSFVGVGVPLLIFYLQTHTFADKTPQEERSEIIQAIDAVAKTAISDANLTKAADFAVKYQGKAIPDNTAISDFRLKRKRKRDGISVTPLAGQDAKTIETFVIHQSKINEGTESKVKHAIALAKKDGKWVAENVAMHKPLRNGYIEKGKYGQEIVKHWELFEDAQHPNIVNHHLGYGWLDESREIVIHELAEGDLRQHQFESSEQFFLFAKKIAEGLDFYHSHKVLFRDLKPANILVINNQPVLADPEEELENKAIGIVGTEKFFPAERFGEDRIQKRSWDLFALGLVLLDMKYTFLTQSLKGATLSDAEKQVIQAQIDSQLQHSSHVEEQIESVDRFDMPKAAHALHLQRCYVPDQDTILNQIFASSDENLEMLRLRLKDFDQATAQLINIDPDKRISAKEVAKILSFSPIKYARQFSMRAGA